MQGVRSVESDVSGNVTSRYGVLAIMTAAQAAASIVQQGIGGVAPFLVTGLALSREQVGLAPAAISAGAAVFAMLAGVAVDRFGERRLILWSGLLMGFALVISAVVARFGWLLAWFFIFGIAYVVATPAGSRAILLRFDRDRGMAMGIRQTGIPIGGALGAVMLPFVAAHFGGYRSALIAGGVICAATCAAAAWAYREPQGTGSARSLREVIRGLVEVARMPAAAMVNLTCVCLVACQHTVVTFLGLALIAEAHVTIAAASLAMSVALLSAIVGRFAWGVVSDRVFGGDRMWPLAVICLMTFASLLWVSSIAGGGVAVAFVAAVFVGLSATSWNGLFTAVLAELGGSARAGSALGLGLAFIFAGGACAPPIFGALADAHGYPAAWRMLALVALLGTIPALAARRLLKS